MLGDITFEEKGTTTGVRVLSFDQADTTVEVSLQTQGNIRGIDHTTVWTYLSKTRADGTSYGEGKGLMTTKDGDVIQLLGSGASKAPSSDGVTRYRGATYFTTTSKKFADLNGLVGVFEYDVTPDGTTTSKIWEWK